MTKDSIHKLLEQKHQELFDFFQNQELSKWEEGPESKWTSGQHLMHLIQSAEALNKGLSLPKMILKMQFGTNNRPSRSYEEVVKKYQDKLALNPTIIAPAAVGMKVPEADQKNELLKRLDKAKAGLQKHLENWKDKELDTYLLPHPLIGKMTLREIIMWIGYHTEHHYKILLEKYA